MAETKHCPYCGEEILAVAKKCKHCGEWLDKTASTEHKNAFQEKMASKQPEVHSTTSNQPVSNGTSGKKNFGIAKGCLIAIAAVVIVIVICFFVSTRRPAPTHGIRYNDSTTVEVQSYEVVEAQPEEYYSNDDDVIEIPGMVQHTEDQGKNIPGDDDPWK